MSRRILVAELKQETATFNPARTFYSDFRIYRGADLLTAYRDTKTELAGAFDVFAANGNCEVVPTIAADAVSGGPIATADLDRLLAEIETAAQESLPVDAACLCLHGAMAGEDEGDPEGRLLANMRAILGNVPIVASLDLHCILTDRMIDAADILVPYHTYPHTDHYETGQRAARNLLRLLDGTAKPTVTRVRLPMLVRGDELLTATGRFGEAIRMCQAVEASEAGLAAGVIIGNAFTDVPALQSNVLITTNNAPEAAQQEAERIGRFMWDNREQFQAQLMPLDMAIQQAIETDGLVVFSDAADATASGAAGDSNAILKGLLKAGFSKQTLIPIVDAPAVAAAFAAGVSGEITVPLGGTRDFTRFAPVTVTARVRSLHDGKFVYENGTMGNGGRTAVLTTDSISLLVTERPVYVVGRRVFQAFGLEPTDFDLVVVKSPNGFRTWYESIASLIVPVDVPGSTSANLKSLPFENCVRPIFPLDEDVPSPF
jgi:microcystin degradation protein MlrC